MNQVSNIVLLSAPDALAMNIEIRDNEIEILVSGGIPPYQYSIDGGASFSNGRVFSDLDPGTYEIIVVDENDCSISEVIEIINTSTSPIQQDLIVELAPNPASDITYLSISNITSREIEISLIDILGRTVRTYDQSTLIGVDQYALDLHNIVAGTYLIRLKLDSRVAVRKLIVE